jgi:hypothetical protein
MAMGGGLDCMGVFNWRGNERGLREEAVAGVFDALDGGLKEEGAEGRENSQRRAIDSTREVLEVGGRADVWGPTVSQRKRKRKKKKGRGGCWAAAVGRAGSGGPQVRRKKNAACPAAGRGGIGGGEGSGPVMECLGLFSFLFFLFFFNSISNLFQTLLNSNLLHLFKFKS